VDSCIYKVCSSQEEDLARCPTNAIYK